MYKLLTQYSYMSYIKTYEIRLLQRKSSVPNEKKRMWSAKGKTGAGGYKRTKEYQEHEHADYLQNLYTPEFQVSRCVITNNNKFHMYALICHYDSCVGTCV